MRFITLLWMLLDDVNPSLTYVNAGHLSPYLISGQKIRKLDTSGILLGFTDVAGYDEETVQLKKRRHRRRLHRRCERGGKPRRRRVRRTRDHPVSSRATAGRRLPKYRMDFTER